MTSQIGVEAAETPADVRAREVEEQITDDERFSLIISLGGATRFTGGVLAGDRAGADVPQVYLTEAARGERMRLLGFELLARFDADAEQWNIDGGTYTVAVGRAADALELTADTTLTAALFG